MILVSLISLFIISFGDKKKVFKNDEIIEKELDPNINTVYDQFVITFDLKCLKEKKQSISDNIEEFLDKFECYVIDEHIKDKFPETIDHWIHMHKKPYCYDDDEMELEWADYCIIEVLEDEKPEWFDYDDYSDDSDDDDSDDDYDINECLSKTISSELLWNLDFVSPLIINGFEYIEYDSNYDPNIDIIIMDSGIDFPHFEFNGIMIEKLFDTNPSNPTLFWHGTHVAGIIVGNNYGVFRAQNTSIKVLDVRIDSNGTDIQSWIPAFFNGFDAIINYLMANPGKKAIINMSFGISNSIAATKRIAAIKANGGIIITSAGNKNIDASIYFPASSNDAITVGATDKTGDKASFSNYGNCIDIWAPGDNILSAFPGNISSNRSGTSMAAPLTTGIAANILLNNPNLDFDGVKQRLLDYAAYEVNDFLGNNTNLPRVQIECDEYCNLNGSACI